VLTDGQGVPLAVRLTSANTNDCQVAIELVDAVPPIRRPPGRAGRPRRRPCTLVADKAYDSRRIRAELRRRRIEPRIAKRGWAAEHGLGRLRWVVERTLAWMGQFRRLRIRYERLPEIHEAFLTIGAALICWNYIQNWFC
jgi:transposase